MSTPTPSNLQAGRHPAQLQAQQAAAAAVTTPNFSSPVPNPPRSVPSPAAQRRQAGKSPFTGSGLPSTSISAAAAGAVGATNMTSSASQTNLATGSLVGGTSAELLGSSPAGAMAGFESPAALRLTLSQFAGLEGGVGMGISMSGISALGLAGSSMGGRGDDEERRKRLEAVLGTLRVKNGRVSEEGIERLSRRHGLEALWEDRRKDGVKVLSIAGQTMLIDITFKSAAVEHVSLILPSSSSVVTSFAEPAGQILRDDLKRPFDIPAVNFTLDKFAKNLERLAKLDRLSSEQVNCFEALSGLYGSLRSLYDHEKTVALKNIDTNRTYRERRAEREVLCNSSGRPNMHGHGVSGLSLDYWMDRRHVFHEEHSRPGKHTTDAVSNENEGFSTNTETTEIREDKIYSLSIECEQCSPELYPPIRISDAWIHNSSDMDLEETESSAPEQSFMEWLEPPPTYSQVSASAQSDAMVLDTTPIGTLPNVRFIAKLDPPVAVPLQVAMQIMNVLQTNIAPESIQPTTMDGLILGRYDLPDATDVPAAAALNGDIKTMRKEKSVFVLDEARKEKEIKHAYRLVIPKPEYGRLLEEIPFSHPRQLVQILPILRQYALFTSLVQGVASEEISKDPILSEESLGQISAKVQNAQYSSTSAFMSSDHEQPTRLSVDIGLSSLPQECFVTAAFPLQDSSYSSPGPNRSLSGAANEKEGPILYVGVQILPNGDVKASERSLETPSSISSSRSKDRKTSANTEKNDDSLEKIQSRVKRLAKAMDVCGDMGLWIEWIRQEKGKRK